MTEQELALQMWRDSGGTEYTIKAEELARQVWEDDGGALGFVPD